MTTADALFEILDSLYESIAFCTSGTAEAVLPGLQVEGLAKLDCLSAVQAFLRDPKQHVFRYQKNPSARRQLEEKLRLLSGVRL